MEKYCAVCKKDTVREPRGSCKPCHLKSQAAWYKKNKEKATAASEKWTAENKEKVLEIKRAWQERNREATRAKNAKWASENLDKYRVYCHNRRHKEKTSGVLSVGIKDLLLKKQNGRCACCGLALNGDYHLDHIVPLALGGENNDRNIQLLHSKCNLQKSSKNPIEFMQQKGFLL